VIHFAPLDGSKAGPLKNKITPGGDDLNKVISARTLGHSEKRTNGGSEDVITTEVMAADGAKYIFDGIIRSAETAEKLSRVTTMHVRKYASKDDQVPQNTEVITILDDITKGDIEGDYRWDTVELTLVTGEGIHKSPPMRVKRRIVTKSAELSDDEVTDKVFTLLGLK
jgi:hypothetical protein